MLIRAMQQPGANLPVPDWVGVMRIAEKWGIEPEAVLHKPSFWVSRQSVLMQAEGFVQQEQAERAKRGG